MSEKVFVPNSFQTPNVFIDEIMARITGAAFKILMIITRYILGYHHDGGVEMSYAAIKKITGLSHQGIINGTDELRKLDLIVIRKGPRSSGITNAYFLNLNLTTGELLKKLEYSKKLTSPSTQLFRLVVLKKVDTLKKTKKQSIRETPSHDSSAPDSENQRDCAMAHDDGFERAWALYPKRAGGNSKKAAYAKWRARVRDGVQPEELLAGVQRYAAFIRATGKWGTEYVKQAETFFGPKEYWREDWTLPSDSGRAAGGFVA